MEARYKRSRQREKILELLQGTKSHPSADWIYERLKKDFKNLSMGTVYRNLGILIDQGFVRKIDFGSTFDRFDANVTRHYHFVCERCGSISDVEMPFDQALNRKAARMGNLDVRDHRIEFFGICGRCGK
ncbi:MAG: transcriptional repressor [Spirochaetes bacterium]|jgi:Fur family peroxide stress response transcriptional regulator|nr:transcriptional repressor [Spirochaetota bacterium]